MNDDPMAGESMTPVSAPNAILPAGLEASRIRNELERIVECALSGNIEDLQKCGIGADAFGQPADYDTNTDHVVRSVAGEVLRRLGQ